MDKTFELVICIDKLGYKKVVLAKGTIDEIDKITTSFENSDEIRCFFSDKVDEFEEKYKTYMHNLSEKNKRKEQGDITIIGTINKERGRVKILYNKHIEVFEYIIRNPEFQEYLKDNYYTEYCRIQQIKNEDLKINEDLSWLIRKVYKIYKQYSKENNKLSPNLIYTHMKKTDQLLQAYQKLYGNEIVDNYQGIYDESNNDPTEPEEAVSYELTYQQDRRDYLKYDLIGYKEEKGRQKVKKIGGGK